MIPTVGAALFIFCTHQMEQIDLTMYKLFIYAAKGLVVTYQKEILPDHAQEDRPPIDTIVDSVLMNYKKLYSNCLRLGSMYVVYELAQQALQLQDSAMEYLSCALTYFNRIVHLNLLHREKLDIMLKMHIIASSSILMQRSVQELEAMFATFVSVALGEPIHSNHANNNSVGQSAAMSNSNLSNNGYGLKRLLCPALIRDEHIPYLVDLSDAYLFASSCLQNIINETARLDQELDATIQIRSSNTNILLSLIATTFLPLTFLAGVFGMNFERNSDYTIELLNMESGPLIFSLMCVLCFLVSVTYFLAQGWIEIALVRKLHKMVSPNKIDDSRKTASPNAMRRAEIEEARREKAKRFRKNLSMHHTHSLRRRTASGHSANGSYNHSTNTSYNSHQNPLLMADYFSEPEGQQQPFKAGSSPEIAMPSRYTHHAGSYVQPQMSSEGGVRESEDSVPSVALSGVSLGSGFLNAIPERIQSGESTPRANSAMKAPCTAAPYIGMPAQRSGCHCRLLR